MSYYTDPHRKKRSKRPFILFFLLLLSALLFFRDRIACEIINYYVGVKFIQNKECPLEVTSITKDHGHLYLKEVNFENQEVRVSAEQVSVYTSIHFFPFSVTAYVDFKRPRVVLKNNNSENSKISLLYFIFLYEIYANILKKSIRLRMSYYTDPHRKKRSKRHFILFFLLLLSVLL